ncbi:MAG: hypothetical protein KDK70_11835 [Myxococcales bacterium]|nr:hypothetical protein [Myxococcales bacterium]
MATANRFLVTWLCAVLLLLGGCKKTLEGEQSAWTANVDKVNAMMAQYPGFKPALEQRLESAKKVHGEAEALSGEAQVEKLASANSTLMRGFVGDLTKVESSMKELRGKRVEAAAKAGDASSRLGAKVAAEDAQKALDRAEAALKAGAKDEASADAVLAKVRADLDTAEAAVDKVLEADKSKKDEAKQADETKKADEAKAKADADAKVAPWTCEYCGTENPHDESNCKSCGAPKGNKDAAKK